MFQAIRKNPSNFFTVVIVLALLFVSIFLWSKAVSWENQITSDEESWYQYPELSRMEIRDTYELAFKKIVLLNGFAFAALFLLKRVKKSI